MKIFEDVFLILVSTESTNVTDGQTDGQTPHDGRRMVVKVLFLVSDFNFLFVPCGGLSWLPVSFLLHVKYTLSYRIVM